MTGSFLTAGYLINDVYASWGESPTISSVKTFPIAELKFPDITVCPPKHTYTSLGYDLKKINRLTFGAEERNRLQNLAVSEIHLHEHENYLKTVAPLFSSEAISQECMAAPVPWVHNRFRNMFTSRYTFVCIHINMIIK